jgi:hypothetical protein
VCIFLPPIFGVRVGLSESRLRDHSFVDIYHKASYHRMICTVYTTSSLWINVECSVVDTRVDVGHCARSLQYYVHQLGGNNTKYPDRVVYRTPIHYQKNRNIVRSSSFLRSLCQCYQEYHQLIHIGNRDAIVISKYFNSSVGGFIERGISVGYSCPLR